MGIAHLLEGGARQTTYRIRAEPVGHEITINAGVLEDNQDWESNIDAIETGLKTIVGILKERNPSWKLIVDRWGTVLD